MASNDNNEQFSRFGIYVRPDGTLASSICHAKPENAGRGECNHFSFADDAKEIQRKLTYYLTERINGPVDKTDGTAGDYMSAFRNWLILEKGFEADKLTDPGATGSIIDTWFDGDKDKYHEILSEAMETSLMAGMRASVEIKETAKAFVDNGLSFRVISNPGVNVNDDNTIARDTNFWMQSNGIDADGSVADKPKINASMVTALSSGDSRVDVNDVEHIQDSFVLKKDPMNLAPADIDNRVLALMSTDSDTTASDSDSDATTAAITTTK